GGYEDRPPMRQPAPPGGPLEAPCHPLVQAGDERRVGSRPVRTHREGDLLELAQLRVGGVGSAARERVVDRYEGVIRTHCMPLSASAGPGGAGCRRSTRIR